MLAGRHYFLFSQPANRRQLTRFTRTKVQLLTQKPVLGGTIVLPLIHFSCTACFWATFGFFLKVFFLSFFFSFFPPRLSLSALAPYASSLSSARSASSLSLAFLCGMPRFFENLACDTTAQGAGMFLLRANVAY